MKVFYREEQTAKKNNSASPSATKPALVVASWKKLHSDLQVSSFVPVTREELHQVHAKKYVDRVLACKQANGFGNTLREVAEALPFVAGSMVAATLHAFKTGETSFSPTSGAHHACYDHGGGYCTFNFLVLAALEAHKAGAKRVGIIDCDMHGGNGTVDIIDKLHLGYIDHYSFGYDQSAPFGRYFKWDEEPTGMIETRNTDQWFKVFTMNVQDIMRVCDIVIYNAGADPHVDDPLGGALTSEELEIRDAIVFRAARQAGTPVAWALAGGYQEPISKVIAIHNATYRVAREWE